MSIKIDQKIEVLDDLDNWVPATVIDIGKRQFWVDTPSGYVPYFYYEHKKEWRKIKSLTAQ